MSQQTMKRQLNCSESRQVRKAASLLAQALNWAIVFDSRAKRRVLPGQISAIIWRNRRGRNGLSMQFCSVRSREGYYLACFGHFWRRGEQPIGLPIRGYLDGGPGLDGSFLYLL